MRRVFFFLGKGGVGKTTSAASLALNLSRRGHTVFWASIDPAHNLWDVLGMEEYEVEELQYLSGAVARPSSFILHQGGTR